ncbi:MAG TPA: efflux transporter outer membrane subunit [Tepidisphaeraceae bacterium]|nr:efflux transporter outer membrane subunit [Tepidisphaeraceae bacterium]
MLVRPHQCCLTVSLLATLLLAGCTVGPDYKPPKIEVAKSFGTQAGPLPATTRPSSVLESKSLGVAQWWTLFNDPTLNELMADAIRSNLDLRLAEARVREARGLRATITGQRYPTVNAGAGYSHQRLSQNAPPYNAFNVPGFPWEFDLYQAGFDASWEIDVFGRVRREVEAANANIEASVEDRRNTLLTLLAETARNYFELRGYQRQLVIAEENLQLQQESVELTRNRVTNGVAPELDLTRAQAQTATTASQIPELRSQLDEALTRLAVLLGTDASQLQPRLLPADVATTQPSAVPPVPPPPPVVPVGLPSDLLRRRPDIRRAERQFAASNARIGAAVADLFPRFSLTGAFNLQAGDFTHLGDWSSRSFNIGPAVSWPIFQAGQLQAAVDVRNEQQQQALVQYQMTVINALREVRNAMTSFGNEQDRRTQLVQAVQADQRSLDMANQLYQQGLLDFLSVLDAQRSLYQSQDSLAQSDRLVTTDLIALYKALGGGWEIESTPH